MSVTVLVLATKSYNGVMNSRQRLSGTLLQQDIMYPLQFVHADYVVAGRFYIDQDFLMQINIKYRTFLDMVGCV